MTPALAFGNAFQGLGYYRSAGVGPDSVKLAGFIREEARSTFRLAVSFQAKFAKILELTDIYKKCSVENWDSEGAEAISEAAYKEAARFIRLLPMTFRMPEIVPEPNGQVGLEWYVRPNHVFIFAIGGAQLVTFAGLFGGESSTHGTEPFLIDSLPESVVSNLQRLLFGND